MLGAKELLFSMKGISINKHKLHKVQMLLEPYSSGAIAHLLYPKHRITFEQENDRVILRIPSFLATELYRRAILPQNVNESVSIEVSGKRIGRFCVVDFRYPNDHSEMVKITFKKVN